MKTEDDVEVDVANIWKETEQSFSELVSTVKPSRGDATADGAAVDQGAQALQDFIREIGGGNGWIFKIKLSDPAQYDGLMDPAAYAELIGA